LAFGFAFAFGFALAFGLDVAFFLAIAIMHLSRLLMRVPRVQKYQQCNRDTIN
jgi:hypothetical protein